MKGSITHNKAPGPDGIPLDLFWFRVLGSPSDPGVERGLPGSGDALVVDGGDRARVQEGG